MYTLRHAAHGALREVCGRVPRCVLLKGAALPAMIAKGGIRPRWSVHEDRQMRLAMQRTCVKESASTTADRTSLVSMPLAAFLGAMLR